MDQLARTALGQLAQSQRGLFSAAQAAQLGITPAQLYRSLRSGHLRRLRRGVYAVRGTPPSAWEHFLAAALAAGPGAAISHGSAAAIHRFYCAPTAKASPELTVRRDQTIGLEGVTVHRSSLLEPEDVVSKYGVLITSPVRTLVDLARRTGLVVLERTLDESVIARQLSVPEVAACLARSAPNLPGRGRLQRLVDLRLESPVADSMLEARAFRALAVLGPFEAHHVVEVGGKCLVLDAAWPAFRVGAEIVGRGHRVASRSAFDRERQKLNILAGAGWEIAHLVATMSDDAMVGAVNTLLLLRGWDRWRPGVAL
jgi:predicted transcriptional regulator of viral defense system